MEIKNFFFLQSPKFKNFWTVTLKKLSYRFILSCSVFLISCQNLPIVENKRNSHSNRNTPTASNTSKNDPNSLPTDDYEDTRNNNPVIEDEIKPEIPLATPSTSTNRVAPTVPKVGIIIGPGFMRSFISVGILQEFHKARVPVQALIGFEWGSLPAALYSMNGQANDVEWQMLKISETSVIKKSIIRNQIESQSITELQGFLNQAFNKKTFEQSRVPFECLTFDYKRKQYFWMKKGDLAKGLSYCLSSPPFSKPLLNNVAAIDLKLAADTLRQKGANYIVFINPISSNKDYVDDSFSPEAQVLWALQQAQLMKTSGIVDFVIETSSVSFSLLDFSARRDMIRKGQEIGAQAVKRISSKLGI